MNLKQFKYVLTLANEGSFSKAADVLNIRQPSLSQYIKNVEREIGCNLFDRTGGNIKLTDAGNAYIQIGKQMLDLEHQLESRLDDISNFQSGTITIGIAAHRSVAFMPEVVKCFREYYPGIVLHIEERKRYEIVDAAEHGEFDLCLTTLPLDKNVFTWKTVMFEENVIAVPESVSFDSESIPERKFSAISVSEINDLDFAVLNEEHPMQLEFDSLCVKYSVSPNRIVLCTSLDALLGMVKNGVASAFIPSCLAQKTDGVKYYSFKENVERREIVIAHRHEQYLSKAVQKLESVISEVLAAY